MYELMNSVLAEISGAWAVCIIVVPLCLIIFLVTFRRCRKCGKAISSNSPGVINSFHGTFCSSSCEHAYRDKEADVRDKELMAGKGTRHTKVYRRYVDR